MQDIGDSGPPSPQKSGAADRLILLLTGVREAVYKDRLSSDDHEGGNEARDVYQQHAPDQEPDM